MFSASPPELGSSVGELGGDVAEPLGDIVEGRAGPEQRDGRAEQIGRAAVVGDERESSLSRLAMCNRAGQGVLELIEVGFLVLVDELSCFDLLDLEPQQIELASTRPGVAAESGQRRVDLCQSSARRAQRREVDRAEVVERATLGRRAEQALVRVLAVQVDELGADLGQRGHRRQATVEVRPRATVGGDDPGEHVLVVVDHEPTLDSSLGRARTNDRGIGPPSDEEVDRFHEHRLAGTGLTGERGETTAEDEIEAWR